MEVVSNLQKKGADLSSLAHLPYFCPVARILAIDFGTKRCGIAVSDPLQIIANPLETVSSDQLEGFLIQYCKQEEVSTIVVGEPFHLDGNPAQIHPQVIRFVQRLKQLFPDKTVVTQDERFTSEDAKKIILASGVRKKKRRDKSLVDRVSAVLILQEYMESQR